MDSKLKTRVERLRAALNIDSLTTEVKALEEKLNTIQDHRELGELARQKAGKQALLNKFLGIESLLESGSEEEVFDLIKDDLLELEKQALLSGPYDSQPAILTIYAGAGGTDAQDWAMMLLRMYQLYVEGGRNKEDDALVSRANWSAELVDISRGEEAGLKNATLIIKGDYAFGLLKVEAGVHRLVRLSPFNAKALRQTSFALVDVIPQIKRDEEVAIDPKELRVDVFRSSGKGGQGVNTTDSAVRLTHLPTGIVVTIQNERSQQQNKQKALEILQARLGVRRRAESQAATAGIRGEVKKNEWGSQIRSYVLHPYKLVKDHRTDFESHQVDQVLNGGINGFIAAYLEKTAQAENK